MTAPVHLPWHSTGLKPRGSGEWLVETHGAKTRRPWRMLPIGMDADTGQIAAALTRKEVGDGSQASFLLDQAGGQDLLVRRRLRRASPSGRFTRVIGDGLFSRMDGRRAAEVDVALHALDRMRDLGRPNSVRVA